MKMERVLRFGYSLNNFSTNSVFDFFEKFFVVISPFEWNIVYQELKKRFSGLHVNSFLMYCKNLNIQRRTLRLFCFRALQIFQILDPFVTGWILVSETMSPKI